MANKRFGDGEIGKKNALEMLERNGAKISGKAIECAKPGLKMLSAIDYLVKYHSYSWVEERKHYTLQIFPTIGHATEL